VRRLRMLEAGQRAGVFVRGLCVRPRTPPSGACAAPGLGVGARLSAATSSGTGKQSRKL
jgi:hypothetical protein